MQREDAFVRNLRNSGGQSGGLNVERKGLSRWGGTPAARGEMAKKDYRSRKMHPPHRICTHIGAPGVRAFVGNVYVSFKK